MLVHSMVVPFSSPQIMRMFLFPGAACCTNATNAGDADRRIESPTAATVSGYFLVIILLPARQIAASRGLPKTSCKGKTHPIYVIGLMCHR